MMEFKRIEGECTRFYGITVYEDIEQGCWFLFSDNGAEQDYNSRPTEVQIEEFRNAVSHF